MRIIVCIKRVPSDKATKIDKKTGALIREPDKLIINDNDRIAIDRAVKIKNGLKHSEIIAISMSAVDDMMLFRECMAMGVDRVVILSDSSFRGSDAWATVNVLQAGINKIGDYDLILTGEISSDGETGQVGIRLADKLDIDHITLVDEISYSDESGFNIKREWEGKRETYNTKDKLLCTVRNSNFEEEHLSLKSISDAFRKDSIEIYNMKDLGLEIDKVGLRNSATYVKETGIISNRGSCRHLDINEIAKEIEISLE